MPSTVNASTVTASRNVCIRGLETLSSTSATPCGRSVTDSSRFILIMPQLLSGRDQPQLPSPARSLSCSLDQTSANQLQSGGRDQRLRQESQNGPPESQPGPATSIRRPPAGTFECFHFQVHSRGRNRQSSLPRAREFQTRLQ